MRAPRLLVNVVEHRTGTGRLDRERIGLDVSAARRVALGRHEVVHLLYGETDHFYAGHLRRLGHLRGNRLVATFHQPAAVLREWHLEPFAFQHLDAAVALGSRAAAHIGGIMGSASVFQASLGVDIRSWHPGLQKSPTPVCTFVGVWLRDIALFKEVAGLVVREKPTVRFEVVTGRAFAESLSVLPNVTVHVGISDSALRAIYQSAWVHILPLVDAVSNNALLEGMACGLPTVTTAVGDVVDYTTERGAICTAPGDPVAMAEAVLRLIEDQRHRDRLGRAGREVAEANSLEISARRHAEIYRKLATSRRRPGSGIQGMTSSRAEGRAGRNPE